jgi:hypothetical protein
MNGALLSAIAAVAFLVGAPAQSHPPGAVVSISRAEVCAPGYDHMRRQAAHYAGLPSRRGYQRDHRIPLCLGGADNPSNVSYEPLAEAHKKDRLERALCRAVCVGQMTLPAAQSMLLNGHWKDAYRVMYGVDP